MSQLALANVSKAFKTNAVLKDVSLSLEPGEIVCIFGPSGSGKTVLLRLVAGVEMLDSGAIELEGRDVTDAPPEQRGLGMAFQNFALFPHMSAFDNVASALTAHSAPKEEIQRKVDRIAALLKITHVMTHAPKALSNGQKQRTALARALVGDPKILLLDDPLRNVDAKLRYEMRLELPSLLKTSGATVLYVTQDYKEAMALGDRIAVLIDGVVEQVANPGGDLPPPRHDRRRAAVRRPDRQSDPRRAGRLGFRPEVRGWRRADGAAAGLCPCDRARRDAGAAAGSALGRLHAKARLISGRDRRRDAAQ